MVAFLFLLVGLIATHTYPTLKEKSGEYFLCREPRVFVERKKQNLFSTYFPFNNCVMMFQSDFHRKKNFANPHFFKVRTEHHHPSKTCPICVGLRYAFGG